MLASAGTTTRLAISITACLSCPSETSAAEMPSASMPLTMLLMTMTTMMMKRKTMMLLMKKRMRMMMLRCLIRMKNFQFVLNLKVLLVQIYMRYKPQFLRKKHQII